MKTIKAIETRYKGYRFRSRLEAKWAVFFDALGIEWEYEKEGYDLGEGGWYLPDFWLPQVSMWAEVKPSAFTEAEQRKLETLVAGTRHDALMLDGEPTTQSYWGIALVDELGSVEYMDYMLQEGHRYWEDEHRYWEDEHRFYASTGKSFPERDGYSHGPGCLCSWCDLDGAVAKARGAQFEHGRHGA